MNRLSRTHILAAAVSGIVAVLLWAMTGCSGLSPTPADSPLATPNPFELLATKRAIMQVTPTIPTAVPGSKETARAMGTNAAATARFHTPQPTVFPPVVGIPAGAGAISEGVAGYSSISYSIQNRWDENTEGGSVRIIVWAGAVADPAGGPSPKGVVLVDVHQRYLDGNVTRTRQVDYVKRLTPCQGGPVRVVDAVGEVLTLQSASGHTFTFDVPARQFLPPPGATPTPTPNPATDWVFTGRVDTGTTDPPPCATITLYRQAGSTWQPLAQTTPSAEGTFSLRAPGPRPPSRFLLSVQYPPGFAPALPVAGPGFVVVDNHTILSVSALGPGEYGGQRFRTTHIPHYDQMPHPPGTPTPPPLPPPPPGTWTPPPPTVVSPLATPTP